MELNAPIITVRLSAYIIMVNYASIQSCRMKDYFDIVTWLSALLPSKFDTKECENRRLSKSNKSGGNDRFDWTLTHKQSMYGVIHNIWSQRQWMVRYAGEISLSWHRPAVDCGNLTAQVDSCDLKASSPGPHSYPWRYLTKKYKHPTKQLIGPNLVQMAVNVKIFSAAIRCYR